MTASSERPGPKRNRPSIRATGGSWHNGQWQATKTDGPPPQSRQSRNNQITGDNIAGATICQV